MKLHYVNEVDRRVAEKLDKARREILGALEEVSRDRRKSGYRARRVSDDLGQVLRAMDAVRVIGGAGPVEDLPPRRSTVRESSETVAPSYAPIEDDEADE